MYAPPVCPLQSFRRFLYKRDAAMFDDDDLHLFVDSPEEEEEDSLDIEESLESEMLNIKKTS